MSHLLRNQSFLTEIIPYDPLDLLVLDDFGLMPLDPNMCRNLLELIDSREGRKSTIVISQLPVKDWFGIFKDNTYADACLDRLVSKAYRLEFNGKNMRNPNLSKEPLLSVPLKRNGAPMKRNSRSVFPDSALAQ